MRKLERLIWILAVALLVIVFLFARVSWPADEFYFQPGEDPRLRVLVRLGKDRAEIISGLNSWQLNHAVALAWVGFSRDGERFTVATCSGNGDYSHAIQRFEQLQDHLWPRWPVDFSESDADLIQSIRSTFELPAEQSDAAVLHWLCEGSGGQALRNRGAWPANEADVVRLPDRARRK